MKPCILVFALIAISGFAAAQELTVPRANAAVASLSSQTASPVLATDRSPSARPKLDPLNSGCFTMRVYKVKRTESVKDGESATRGYSTCEPGFQFQVRTAVAADHSQAK